MQINNYQTFNSKEVAFGKIRPEHLFINSPGYDRNVDWANSTIDTIEIAKKKIQQNDSFNNLITFIAEKYHDFFATKARPKYDYFGTTNLNLDFGKLRTDKSWYYTYITEKNRYAPYVEKFASFMKKNGINLLKKVKIGEGKHSAKYYQACLQRTFFFDKGLSIITLAKDNLSLEEQQKVGKYLLRIDAPDCKAIAPTFKKIEPIYKKIIENKKSLTPENIETITKDVAQIHWYLSQAMPFRRGGAGITDALCKTLFESKGIQVSPYKPNIDPNMEAYVLKLEDYVNEYKNFFEKPLVPIK